MESFAKSPWGCCADGVSVCAEKEMMPVRDGKAAIFQDTSGNLHINSTAEQTVYINGEDIIGRMHDLEDRFEAHIASQMHSPTVHPISAPTSAPSSPPSLACSSNPCKNGATCQEPPFPVEGRICLCPAGFSGQYCEVDIPECASSPCKNGGTCTDKINGYECACTAGWTGSNCEMVVESSHSGTKNILLSPYTGTRSTVGWFKIWVWIQSGKDLQHFGRRICNRKWRPSLPVKYG